MSLRSYFLERSTGDNLAFFWRLYRLRSRVRSRWANYLVSYFLNRSAHRHGGYIGNGAYLADIPSLPHGLHGIYISRYARIGEGCRIYQNVTIGEVGGRAPRVGARCLIGANACLVGDIVIGDDVRIGAGAVVAADIPDGCTVVAQPPRILPGEKS